MTRETDRTSTEIEREVERQRAEMAETLEALRGRMTPGRMVDETWEFVRDRGGGDFVRNLGTSVRDNPLPIALVGAGIAWLMSGRGGGLPRLPRSRADADYDEDIYDYRRYQGERRRFTAASLYEGDEDDAAYRTPYTLEDAEGESTKSGRAGESLADKARNAGARARDAAVIAGEDVADAVGDAAGYVGDRVSAVRRAARRRSRRLGDRAWRSGRRVQDRTRDLIEEQPLAFALAGLALGALLGASVRSTATERGLMGETSDRMKEGAGDMARRGLARTVEAAERTYDAMRDEAETQNLTPDAIRDATDDLAERARRVADKGREKLREEVGSSSGILPPSESAGF